MAKQLNIALNLQANTTQAKQSLQSLQTQLTKIANMSTIDAATQKLNTGLVQASQAARELQYHLTSATNVKTGNLDMGKFSTSLKKANADLGQLSGKLLQAGTTGQSAFVSLASSIANADRHAITLGSRLTGLLTTLKNTARWQLSSMMLHGFINTIREAYNYAQDLNKSLNNIRIVTGLSADEMANFAEQANKAAKALSTSTLKYTDAALIYYQQGIRDQKEIEERTTATIKLANVTRQSAEEVSSQLTAIWNNFDDGTQSLEYYADAITALGAATASSSAEIAEGLQKFAAVADTVGLSYEKATAALATVVAQTRQSADIVGTAFKTIFARIEGLKVGDTLEDGVTLNQYSTVLKKIGVNILDANGQLKDMDTILDSIGAKWDSLNQSTKVATAQQVAGLRQYQQFIALMDNYKKVLSNQQLAEDSEGTLQKQQDIYAEGWEAASKRVKASLESVYNDLLDDKFFIRFTDGFAKIINGLSEFIKGIGGVKSLLIGLGGLFLSSVSSKILPTIQNIKLNLITMFQSPMQQAQQYKSMMDSLIETAKGNLGLNFENANDSIKNAIQGTSALAEARNRLLTVSKQLTPEESRYYEQELALLSVQLEENQVLADRLTEEKNKTEETLNGMTSEASLKELEEERTRVLEQLESKTRAAFEALQQAQGFAEILAADEAYVAAANAAEEYNERMHEIIATKEQVTNSIRNAYIELIAFNEHVGGSKTVVVDLSTILEDTANKFINLGNNAQQSGFTNAVQQYRALEAELKQMGVDIFPEVQKALSNMNNVIQKSGGEVNQLLAPIRALGQLLSNLKITGEASVDGLKAFANFGKQLGDQANFIQIEKSMASIGKHQLELTNRQNLLNSALAKFNPAHLMSGVEMFSRLASAAMQAAMVINSIRSLVRAFSSEDMSPMERLSTILMSFGMLVPGVIGAIKSLSAIYKSLAAAKLKNISLTGIENVLTQRQGTNLSLLAQAQQALTEQQRQEIANDMIRMVFKGQIIDKEKEEVLSKALVNLMTKRGNDLTAEEVSMTMLSILGKKAATSAENTLTVAKLKGAAASWAASGPLIIILAVLVALIATIALLVIGIKALTNWLNKDTIAAERAAAAAENLKKVYEETKEAYDQLKESIANYQESLDAIGKLTQGTVEWQEAIIKANEEAMKLIDTYAQLTSDSYYIDEDTGLIVFKDGVLKDLSASMLKDVAQTFSISRMATATAQTKLGEAQKSSFVHRNDPSLGDWIENFGYIAPIVGQLGGLVTDYAMGNEKAVARSIGDATKSMGLAALGFALGIPGVSNLAAYFNPFEKNAREGEKTAARTEGWYETLNTQPEEFRQRLRKGLVSEEELKKVLHLSDDELVKTLKENIDAINKNTDQQEATANQIADQNLRDESGYLKYSAAATEIASEAYERANARIYDEVIQASHVYRKDQGKADLETNYDSIWNRYLRAIGQEKGDYHLVANAIQGSDTAREYHFRVGTGDEQSVTEEQMATAIAAAEALEELTEAAKEAQKTLNNLHDEDFEGKGFGKTAFESLIATGGTEELTEAEHKAIMDAKGDRTWEEFFQDYFSPEIAKDLGDKFDDKFNDIDWDHIADSLTDHVREPFESVFNTIKGSLTGKEATGLRELFRETFADLGTEGVNTLSQIFKHFTLDDQAKIAKIAGSFDFTIQSTDDFINALIDAGITLGDNEANIRQYINSMIAANLQVKNATTEYKNLEKVLKDLKSNGYVEAEDFDKLFKNNWSQYFSLMADGTYKLIGDAQSFYDLVHQQEQQNFIDQITESRENIKSLNNLAEFNFDGIIGDKANTKLSEETKLLFFHKRIADEDVLAQQLELIKTLPNKTDEMQEMLEHSTSDTEFWTTKWLEKAQTIVDENFKTPEQIAKIKEDAKEALRGQELGLVSTAQSLTELDFLVKENNLTIDVYQQGLMTLATQFENAAEESREYALALQGVGKLNVYEAENLLKLSIRVGELSKAYGLDSKELEQHAKLLKSNSNYEKLSSTEVANLAAKNERMNRGVKALNENFADWKKTLTSTNKISVDYAEVSLAASEAIADLTGALDAAHIPADFLEAPENLALLEKAAKGDTNAIRDLGIALAESQLQELLSTEQIDQTIFDQLTSGINSFKEALQNGTLNVETLGQTMRGDWVMALNEMADQTKMSVEEMNSFLSELGVSIPVETKYIDVDKEVPVYTTRTYTSVKNGAQPGEGKDEYGTYTDSISTTFISGYDKVKEKVGVATIGKNSAVTYVGATGGGGVAGSSTDSGSKSSSSSPTKSVKTPEKPKVDPYKPVQDQLDKLTNAYDKANAAKDRLYGAEYMANIKQEISLISQLANTQKKYTKVAEAEFKKGQTKAAGGEKADASRGLGISYTSKDSSGNQTLNWIDAKSLKELIGFDLQYDEEGNVINYNQAQEALEQGKRNLINYFNGLTAAEQEAMTNSGWYDMWMSQYDFQIDNLKDINDSHKKIIESQKQEIEYQHQLQDENYEAYKKSVEYRKKINQLEQDNLDHMMKRLGDDSYKTAEGRSYLLNSAKVDTKNIADVQIEQADLDAKLAKGEISQAQYQEGTEANYENVSAYLENVYDKRDQNREYYANALGKLNNEIQVYTELLSGNTNLLDHMKNTVSLMNKSTNFEAIGKILEAQKEDAERNLNISKQLYDVKRKEADSAFATYEKLKGTGTEAERTAKEAWETAEKEAKEAENNMYENTEKVINATDALIQNSLDKIKQAEEYLFTDGMGWDYVNKSMDLSEKYADKYLTKTNQVYETNKMLRNLQADIDKTTNTAAKQKLANFEKEIQKLQEVKELSKGQLEIAQAQYDLLKAQIELEEAQNAKSVVRLQRDAEGNYGYVYTADADKTADANQKVADAENNLYNKNLDLSRSSLQELSSLEQSYQNDMNALRQKFYIERSITQEQFDQQSVMLTEKYNKLKEGVTKDYLVASEGLRQTSITGENDDWTKEYEDLGNKLSAYIDESDDFWTKSYGALTKKREDWFNTENPEWTKFYNGISTTAQNTKTVMTTIADELKEKMVGADGESGVIGDLQKKINDITGLGKDFRDTGVSADVFGDKLTGDKSLASALKSLGVTTDSFNKTELTNLDTKLGEVKTDSEKLEKVLTDKNNGLIIGYEKTAAAVRMSVQEFSNWYDETEKDRKKAEEFRQKLNELLIELNKGGIGTYTIVWEEKPATGYPPELEPKSTTYTIYYQSNYDGFYGDPSGGKSTSGNPGPNTFTSSRYTYTFQLTNGTTKTLYSGEDSYKYYRQYKDIISQVAVTNNDTNNTVYPTDYEQYLHYMSQIGFDTGGYTGKWFSSSQNPEENGKLAVLHQKELVLNQEDTKNILTAVNLVRSLQEAMDLRTAAYNFDSQLTSGALTGNNGELEQNITIHADFPNVQDHNEIKEALESLALRAVQYAARNN